MDYTAVSTTLEFAACASRECVNITIENDQIPELTESFFVDLEETPGLDDRITLDPVLGEIDITDMNSESVLRESHDTA